MEVNYTKEFIVLAETCSYSEASEQLCMSQASLSRHIMSLEEELGVTLFERTNRKVSLGSFGKLFLPYAKEIVQIQEDYTAAIRNQVKLISDTLTIGTIPVMAPYTITDILTRFQKENPNLTLEIIEADPYNLVQMVRENKCDFAFIRGSINSEEKFVILPFTSDTVAAIFPVYHPLANSAAVSLEQLRDEPLLLLSKDTFMYSFCTAECQKAGFDPRVVFTSHRIENIIDIVIRGMGVALLTKKPVTYLSNPNISVVDIVPYISTSINLVHNKSKKMNTASKLFLKFIKLYGPSEIAP